MIKAEFSGNLFKRCFNRFLVKIGCRPTELDTWEPHGSRLGATEVGGVEDARLLDPDFCELRSYVLSDPTLWILKS